MEPEKKKKYSTTWSKAPQMLLHGGDGVDLRRKKRGRRQSPRTLLAEAISRKLKRRKLPLSWAPQLAKRQLKPRQLDAILIQAAERRREIEAVEERLKRLRLELKRHITGEKEVEEIGSHPSGGDSGAVSNVVFRFSNTQNEKERSPMSNPLQCPACFTPLQAGVICPVCGARSKYNDQGELVFTLGERPARVLEVEETEYQGQPVIPEPYIPPGLDDESGDVVVCTLNHASARGLDKPVTLGDGLNSPFRVPQFIDGGDLEALLREPTSPSPPAPHRSVIIGPSLDSLLKGGD